jgi:hypothetical protein
VLLIVTLFSNLAVKKVIHLFQPMMYRSTSVARAVLRRIPKPLTAGGASRITATPRRSFFSTPESILEPELTPKEDLLLDFTAWFVAIAIVYSPEHDFDDLDYQHMGDLQEEVSGQNSSNEKSKDPKDHTKKGH